MYVCLFDRLEATNDRFCFLQHLSFTNYQWSEGTAWFSPSSSSGFKQFNDFFKQHLPYDPFIFSESPP